MKTQRHNLPPLIGRMLETRFYRHPTTEPIRLVQTHISFVLLTGAFAYKIKKAVKLPFADFSTLDLRRHFCQEEIRLNRRGAPDLYLDVVSIGAAGDGFAFGGPGEPVEYAVKMRQFPQDSLFSEMLRQGRLGEDEIEALARVVAAYHAIAATSPAIAEFGQANRLVRIVEDNFRQSEMFIGTLQTTEHFEQIRAFARRFFEEHHETLERRAQSGRTRECHGDLHLDNICLWQGKVNLFDCIEFNESFRNVDVMHDVAFTAMDLESAGRKDLATLLLNTYTELTGDWEGIEILPLSLCRQAYVRGKVNSLMSREPEVSEQEQRSATARAILYYKLACDYAQPRQGKLLIVCGLSGSGKSTAARKLAMHEGAVHIRSDAIRKHLAGLSVEDRGGPELYTPQMTARTYARLQELGIGLAGQGFYVILDAKFDRTDLRERVIRKAVQHGIPVEILYCEAPIQVRRLRARDRYNDASDATPAIIDQQAEFEGFSSEELPLVRKSQSMNAGL